MIIVIMIIIVIITITIIVLMIILIVIVTIHALCSAREGSCPPPPAAAPHLARGRGGPGVLSPSLCLSLFCLSISLLSPLSSLLSHLSVSLSPRRHAARHFAVPQVVWHPSRCCLAGQITKQSIGIGKQKPLCGEAYYPNTK